MIRKEITSIYIWHDREHGIYDQDYCFKVWFFGIRIWKRTYKSTTTFSDIEEKKIGFGGK